MGEEFFFIELSVETNARDGNQNKKEGGRRERQPTVNAPGLKMYVGVNFREGEVLCAREYNRNF